MSMLNATVHLSERRFETPPYQALGWLDVVGVTSEVSGLSGGRLDELESTLTGVRRWDPLQRRAWAVTQPDGVPTDVPTDVPTMET